jgi:hypothetical protein
MRRIAAPMVGGMITAPLVSGADPGVLFAMAERRLAAGETSRKRPRPDVDARALGRTIRLDGSNDLQAQRFP